MDCGFSKLRIELLNTFKQLQKMLQSPEPGMTREKLLNHIFADNSIIDKLDSIINKLEKILQNNSNCYIPEIQKNEAEQLIKVIDNTIADLNAVHHLCAQNNSCNIKMI